MNAQWSDDFHHAMHTVLTGELNGYYEDFGSLQQLGKALQRAYVYDGIYSVHRDRLHGRPVVGLSGHHFLGYSQNHDQIGNRARGERLSQLVSVGRQKIAAALVLTSPFVPMFFQGEEFGASTPFQYFTHHHDKELAKAVSEGRRGEFAAFGWNPEDVPDPQDLETLQRSKLRWDEIKCPPHDEILAWYRALIDLRRSNSRLTDGNLEAVEVRCDERAQWLAVKRGEFEVVYNLAAERQAIPIERTTKNVICSEGGYEIRPGFIELPPDAVAILR
jgi:maltooligosyltrehalose trehalohydrolase